MSTWLLIPCHQPRLAELTETLAHLGHPAERTVIVTTNPESIEPGDVDAVAVLCSPQPGVNISRWWNVGLDWIAAHAGSQAYEVLCMESDVRISWPTLCRLQVMLRRYALGMVGADWRGVLEQVDLEVDIRRDLTPPTVQTRIPGVCMLVAGELGLRFDEQFRWWYADDDFEWQHRRAGGTGLVAGTIIEHGLGHPLEGVLASYAEVDYRRFVAKWGAPNVV